MANVKFSNLTAATSVASTDILPIVSSGASAATKATADQARQFVMGSSGLSNGQDIQFKSLTELLTIAASATSTTAIQLPANTLILAVSTRVTTAVTCTTSFSVGDAGSAVRYSLTVAKAAGTTDPGNRAGAFFNATARGVIITPDTTPSDATGRVRVTIHYLDVTPATS